MGFSIPYLIFLIGVAVVLGAVGLLWPKPTSEAEKKLKRFEANREMKRRADAAWEDLAKMGKRK